MMKRLSLILSLCLALSACATDEQTHAAVTGGAIGAAAGAVMSDQPVNGAIIGGALGAAAGAILSDPNRRGDRRAYRHDRGRHEGEYRRHERDDGYRYDRHGDDDEGDD